MHVVIFTEAGTNFGLGHLSRCIALKSYLSAFDVIIYNRGDYKSNDCIYLEWIDEKKEVLDDILKSFPLVFVDSYYADYEFCKYVESKSKVCVFFDDFNRMKYPQDSIILNGALNAQKYYINVCNEKFIGIEYFLLRKEFTKKENKIINKDINKILIIIGGLDEANNTQKILEIVEKEFCYASIDVVLGKIHSPITYGFSTNVHFNLKPDIIKNLMLDCDIAISGGGVTMVELQSTATPTIALQIAPNQAYQLRAWQKEGLRVAENVYQIKKLLKTLTKFKDRKKLHNRLVGMRVGASIPFFINKIIQKYNS